ncbi:MAG: cephalosporin hydroxylase family protein [Bacteroidetes bacterium]|nr:cephalosporin hydroxylase family protein [Bacteroidota bacterium]
MDPISQFEQEKKERIEAFGGDEQLQKLGFEWLKESMSKLYVYNFNWMGRPIIQTPQDMFAMQEIIWKVKPDLIIETGIAHGGSLVYYASLLEMMGKGEVLGIDIDIRVHNKKLIEEHPMYKRIMMIEGSSVDKEVIEKVREVAAEKEVVLVCLDSNHTHDHVLSELRNYSAMVTKGSYIIVFDTHVEDMPAEYTANRPWGPGNSPKTAARVFLKETGDFELDTEFQNKVVATTMRDGCLLKVN